jgi:glycosyltransferase involved in cell wall biosynthesis
MQATPLITVGIVAYNRAWIIKEMLGSLQNQNYPHSDIFVLFVDGVSKDGTAEAAEQILAAADFGGYEVLVQKCNIPEGRNICLDKMKGELLLFWDSDVIMPSDTVRGLVEALQEENADLMTAVAKNVTVTSTSEIPQKLQEIKPQTPRRPRHDIKAVMMGQSLLTKKLAKTVTFDPQLTIQEDTDYCLRAKALGFKIIIAPNLEVLDINMFNVAYSDICIDMSFGDAMKGIKRKSQVQVYAYHFGSQRKNAFRFFSAYKRYLFYLLYIPTIILTIVGVFLQNIPLALVFPIYALFYTALQIRRRGVKRGIRAFALSLVVGIPNAFWVTVYWIECVLRGNKPSSA